MPESAVIIGPMARLDIPPHLRGGQPGWIEMLQQGAAEVVVGVGEVAVVDFVQELREGVRLAVTKGGDAEVGVQRQSSGKWGSRWVAHRCFQFGQQQDERLQLGLVINAITLLAGSPSAISFAR